jgi:hypothetical protein
MDENLIDRLHRPLTKTIPHYLDKLRSIDQSINDMRGGEGSGDRLRSPADPRQSPGRGPGGPSPPEALGFEELQTFI